MATNFMDEIDQRANLAFTNQMEMLTFYLTDQQQYGINVFKIIEVIETPKTVTRVPQSHPAIIGAINFRDKLVTVIDLGLGLGLDPVNYQGGLSYVIICEYSNTIQGFLISRPNKLVNKSWADIKSPGSSIQSSGYLTALTYDDDDKATQILDVEKILGEIIGFEVEVKSTLLEEGRSASIADYTVLAVDDSKAARLLLARTLGKLGVGHVIYENADQAFNALQESIAPGSTQKFCLIISDIEMPGMDGFTFTRKVKAIPQLASIPLVLHSSMSNQANTVKAQQVGADNFVAKFQPDAIARVVLDQIQLLRQSGRCDAA
ncbi:MAG: chemotaxis protein CheV [Magnetococcales bacterium]|nr:chemotaxis protein CheV [Magnetococcales bacterium]